ncbi:luciferin 4-monooxygenase-like [Polyergus mexicanus]|uniref:luciferin 4-monooxygenase-like n=1 Tax=Polyergus mexicanus TaxID=615972 RepID=UPI0038B63763
MASESTVPFKIQNDVLIGEENSVDNKCINIGELILNKFKSKPDFIGQVDAKTGEENTFQQMRERSVKCALWLKKCGVECNDIVTMCTSNHLDTYIPYLASLYIGAINLRHYLQSGPKVIFTDIDKAPLILNVVNMMKISTKIVVLNKKSNEEEKFESLKSILNSDFDEDEINEFTCAKLENDRHIAVTLFSSGTIGDIRKHVAISHAFFTSPSNQQIPVMSSNDVGLWVESLHWSISLLLTVRAILSYVKAVKINEFLNPSFEKCFCDIIQKYKVTWVFLKIAMGNDFYKFNVFKKYDVSSLKQIIFGGRISLINKYEQFVSSLPDASVIQAYCLPEMGVVAYQRETGKSGSSGYVSKTVHLMITHYVNGSILKSNKMGIISCKSSYLMNVCFNSMPGELVPVTDNSGWFNTDDVGYYDSDGDIYILDRKKYIIQYKKSYFLPAHIEQVLLKHPEVEDAGVIPIFNTFDCHHPLAFVVRKKGSKVTQEELIQFVAENVIDCMKLRAGVLFRQELKYLPNGWLDRRTLCKWAKDDLKDKIFFAKRTSKKA